MTKRDPRISRRLPLRVESRPSPDQWGEDELLTLEEATCLFWPDGPLTTTSLRTAQRDGQLAVARIAGKVLTTRGAVETMVKNSLSAVALASRPKASPRATRAAGSTSFQARIEALVAPGPSSEATAPSQDTTT